MKDKGRLIIIAAPSGTGKTTLIRRFLSTHPNMVHSVSCTTRPMRPGDKEGRDYHFMTDAQFKEGIKRGEFAEWARVHDHLYGTSRGPLDKWLKEKKDILLDLDVIGSLNLKKIYGARAISIFLVPPTMDELKRRLSQRGTDAPNVQKLRLRNAVAEMSHKDRFDHQVINDDLERACEEIERIIGI